MNFSASIVDADINARVYYKWILDYPPDQMGVTNLGNQGSVTTGATSSTVPINLNPPQPVNCAGFITVMAEHRLEVVVSNKEFSPTSTVLDTPDDPTAIVDSREWTIQATCSAAATSGTQ